MTDLFMHIRIRASATSMAIIAMAVLVFEGKMALLGFWHSPM